VTDLAERAVALVIEAEESRKLARIERDFPIEVSQIAQCSENLIPADRLEALVERCLSVLGEPRRSRSR
jgi:hypothetical protein